MAIADMDDDHDNDYPDPVSSPSFTPYPTLSSSRGYSQDVSSSTFPSQQAASSAGPQLEDAIRTYRQQAAQWWSEQATTTFRAQADAQTGIDDDEDAEPTVTAGALMANAFLDPQRAASGDMEDSEMDDAVGGADEGDEDSDEITYDTPRKREPGLPSRGKGSRGGGRGKGRGRGWKAALKRLEERNPELRIEDAPDRTRQARRGRGRPRGRPTGSARAAAMLRNPGSDFKQAQADAMQAFLANGLDNAQMHVLNAIQANSQMFQAHSLYSEILSEMGRHEDAVGVLIIGASTIRQVEPWVIAGRRTLDLADGTRPEPVVRQALMCFNNAKTIERDNLEARAGIMECCLELGDMRGARFNCRVLMHAQPENLEIIRQFAEMSAESRDWMELKRAKEAYDTAFAMCREVGTSIDAGEQWSHLNVYLEVLDKVSGPAEGVFQLRSLARWFLDRPTEDFWDRFTEDDREYDTSHERRALVPEFQQGLASRDLAQYGDGLPLELRVKLGIFRLKMGMRHHEAALEHFERLMQFADQVEMFYDIFFIVAENLRKHRLFKEALRFFEPIGTIAEVINNDFLTGIAECYRYEDRLDEAEERYLEAIDKYPDEVQARTALAKMYVDMGEREKALPLLKQVVRLGHRELLRKEELPYGDIQRQVQATVRERRRDTDSEMLWQNEPDFDLNIENFTPAGPGTFGEFNIAPAPDAADEQITYDIDAVTGRSGRRHDSDAAARKAADKAQRAAKKAAKLAAKLEAQQKTRRRYRSERRIKLTDKIRERLRQINDQEPGVHRDYDLVKELWPDIEAEEADDEEIEAWIASAQSMVDVFMSMDVFYHDRQYTKFTGYGNAAHPRRKEVDEATLLMHRLENENDDEYTNASHTMDPSVPRQFHDIPFSQWHRIICNLALQHASRANQDQCYHLIRNGLLRANVFTHDPNLHNISLATFLCSALQFNDSAVVTDIARQYISKSHFRAGEPFQFITAANRLAPGGNWFNAGPTQKFLLRAVKMQDHLLMTPTQRKNVNWGAQTEQLCKRAQAFAHDSGNSSLLDASLLVTYGHMVNQANFSHSSLPYYFRALALQPNNAGFHLCIAIVYIQVAMKRQTDNRQSGIQQGLSFLFRYYELRTTREDGKEAKRCYVQEAEFNVGRAWHMLGLTHLAVERYRRVIELREGVRREFEERGGEREDGSGDEEDGEGEDEDDNDEDAVVEDYAAEAAFALQQIYSLAGNVDAAARVTEEVLVL